MLTRVISGLGDPGQRRILLCGMLALVAVGLVPRVLSPGLPSAQEQIREQPQIQSVYLLLSFLSAAAVIAGGFVSDVIRMRAVILVGLGLMLGGALVCLVIDDGPIYYLGTGTAIIASGAVLAYAIGSVAVAFDGVQRATALGLVYAAYGAGSALAPLLLTIIVVRIPSGDPTEPAGFSFETWLAYIVAAATATIALVAAARWMPRPPGSLPAPRQLVAGIALWSISILAIVVGALGFSNSGAFAVPMALVGIGVIGLAGTSYRMRRIGTATAGLKLDQRALGAALAVGVTMGVAQAVPLLALPFVFSKILDYGPIFGTLAIAPFVLALIAAGPVSGVLLNRFGPRGMMTVGTLALGIAGLALAAIIGLLGRDANYLLFVLPLVLIGAGFVLATTVRTAIVFASTPRGLSGMAAAVNEASVALGARLGIVVATALIASQAIASAERFAAGRPDAQQLVDEFRSVLASLGTPRFEEVISAALDNAPQIKINAYLNAYLDGVQMALLLGGLVGIAGAVLAWLLTGRRDPLHTVFDMQDERSPGDSAVAALETV